MLFQILKNSVTRTPRLFSKPIKQNVINKRWSGHDVMVIEPSSQEWKEFKNEAHFYFLLSSVPVIVVMAIVGARANPELTEVPEGYEPRHWEYYRHPVTRFAARYMYYPVELDKEMALHYFEDESENAILRRVAQKTEKAMAFYNDHRSTFFIPYFAEMMRKGRDEGEYAGNMVRSSDSTHYDNAYNPYINPVPTEGYVPTSVD